MSIPAWIRERCVGPELHLNETPRHDQLNELSQFLESNQSNGIEAIEFSQILSIATLEAIFKCLPKKPNIYSLRIRASHQHVSSILNDWMVKLNQAPDSIDVELEIDGDLLIQPWLRSAQLNTTIMRFEILDCSFGSFDVNELLNLLSSNYSITELVFNTRRWIELDGFVRLCAHLESDPFIESLTIDYENEPVRDCHGMALAQLLKSRLKRNRALVLSPVELLLSQTEQTKEVERRKLIKQMKMDDFIQTHSTSQTKSVHTPLTNEEKEEDRLTMKKLSPESSLATGIIQSAPLSVLLPEYDVEYLRVSLDFYESFAGMPDYHGLKFKVTQIERVTNLALKKQFDQSYQYFMTHNYHSKRPIRAVYHSTKPENIPSIIRSNLSLVKTGTVTDSGWFGKGMYFSPHADYTLMYYSTGKFERVAAGDSGKVLRFDIMPGRMLRMSEVKVGGERTIYYDSHVSPNEFEYVMFDSRHILPRYVISFSVTQSAGSKFQGSVEQVGH